MRSAGAFCERELHLLVHRPRDRTVALDQERIFGHVVLREGGHDRPTGGIHVLNRLAHVFVGHRRVAVLVFHVVGAETAAVALLGVEAGHAQQRIDHLSVAARVRYAAVLPEGFEVFGEDVLFGFPALGVGIVETVLQVGITARVVGLHDAVVEQFGDLLVHGIGYAVDHEQPSRTRFRTHVLAQAPDRISSCSRCHGPPAAPCRRIPVRSRGRCRRTSTCSSSPGRRPSRRWPALRGSPRRPPGIRRALRGRRS